MNATEQTNLTAEALAVSHGNNPFAPKTELPWSPAPDAETLPVIPVSVALPVTFRETFALFKETEAAYENLARLDNPPRQQLLEAWSRFRIVGDHFFKLQQSPAAPCAHDANAMAGSHIHGPAEGIQRLLPRIKKSFADSVQTKLKGK